MNDNIYLSHTRIVTYRDEGRVVMETDVLLADQSRHLTAVGGDFLLKPLDPAAARLIELRD